ncbi:MAG: hypothetical protein FWF12_03560 [Betaproteobacteria bacterium]|nr:hypothetical protein [Betaproteobacteria bacterium]
MNITADDPTNRYALAREAIDRERAHLETERLQEEEREVPSHALLKYLDTQMNALLALWEKLSLEDTAAMDSILNGIAIAQLIIQTPEFTNVKPRTFYKSDNPIMRFVVAREDINRERARLSVESLQEQKKEMLCPVLIEFFNVQITALLSLWTCLPSKDTAAVDLILNRPTVTRHVIQAQELVND